MEATFLQQLAEALERDEDLVSMDGVFWDYDEWDSLNALSVLEMIFDNYELTIPRESLMKCQTVQDLYTYIMENKPNG